MHAETNTDERIKTLHTAAAEMLRSGQSDEEIIQKLLLDGVNDDYAWLILENVKNDFHDRRRFWKLLASGSFFITGGFAVNYFSYKIAAAGGGMFFYLFWGILVTGIVLIIRACILFRR